MVSPVKNQMNCNACWAFSAVERNGEVSQKPLPTGIHDHHHSAKSAGLRRRFPVVDKINLKTMKEKMKTTKKGFSFTSCLKKKWSPCQILGSDKPTSIESHVKIYTNEEVILSEQFLLDCDKRNAGCNSASILKTFSHIVTDFGGVLRQQDYCEYSGWKMACRWCGQRVPVPVVGFKRVLPNEDEMLRYVYHYGPLSAAINSASMVKYTYGIDQPTKQMCPPDQLNHAVLIVGYNEYVSEDGKERVPYWIIKNSWGEKWGDKGFYYLERGRNACGIASDVSFPFVN